MQNKITNKNKKVLSKTNDKRSELLIKVDNLMEKLESDYGPFLLEELNKRLEKTIEDFHNDLKSILENSFDAYESKLSEMNKISEKYNEISTPTFIAEYESKVKNKKKG